MIGDLVLDTYTPLSHKASMDRAGLGIPGAPPSWVGDHARRLRAYTILHHYLENIARGLLKNTSALSGTADPRNDHREYGDPSLLVEQAVAALLGDEQAIAVDGADLDPENLPDDVTPEQVQRAADFAEWYRQWADDEQLWQQLSDAEHDAVGLGDGVYALAWDPVKNRVRVETYDPGFYFPVIDPRAPTVDFPDTVHVAWEFEQDSRKFVHRITWRLAPIEPVRDENGLPVLSRRANPDGSETVSLVAGPGDEVLPDGRIGRRYPWQAPGDQPSTMTCYLTEATWDLGKVTSGQDVETLNPDAASYVVRADGTLVRDLDLRFDFIPVVHVRNAGPRRAHFGASLLLKVAQILDDLASTDTDLQAAAATTGSPPLVFKGGTGGAGKRATVGPGQVFSTDGDAEFLDTSKNLDALLKLQRRLRSLLSENSRMPELALGRLDPTQVEAGIIIALSFGPMQALIRSMRLVRDAKYPLLLRFAARIAMAGGDPTLVTGPVPVARIVFGSYLPADVKQVVEQVTALLNAHAISTLTAVRMLAEAGLPITDAAAEVERIQRENFEAAERLFNAAGEGPVFDFLGIESPAPGPSPEPEPAE